MTAHKDKAKVHIDRGEIDQAAQCLGLHLNVDFHDEEALMMLGACYLTRGNPGVAAALTHQAIEVRKRKGKQFPEALKNLGACFKAENNFETALKIWELALDQETDRNERAEILSNIGGCYLAFGQPGTALKVFNKALELRPDFPKGRFNRSFAHLALGHWKDGWEDYALGFKSGDRRNRFYRDIPEWDGSPGKTVIVWGEQGVGDEIQFASCLPDLQKIAKKVIFDCHPRLVNLMQRSFPEIEIHGTRKIMSGVDWVEKSDADASIPISMLPKFFRNANEDFPGTPYLKAQPLPRPDKIRIGIAWSGGEKGTLGHKRSIPLKSWFPILQQNADFFSLEYKPTAAADICNLEEETGVRVAHYPGWVQCTDYDKTASFVGSLDLVITVQTAVRHLCGALGVPCWVLAQSAPSWSCTPASEVWYRSLRYYRQSENWTPVIEEVAKDVADFCRVQSAQRLAA